MLASAEHMMIAAAMSTSLLAFITLRYGKPMIRLAGVTVATWWGSCFGSTRRVGGGDGAEVRPNSAM